MRLSELLGRIIEISPIITLFHVANGSKRKTERAWVFDYMQDANIYLCIKYFASFETTMIFPTSRSNLQAQNV